MILPKKCLCFCYKRYKRFSSQSIITCIVFNLFCSHTNIAQANSTAAIIPPANTKEIALLFKFISSESLFNTLVYLSIVLSYFLFLFFTSKDTSETINTLSTQIIYSTILYIFIRIYFAYVFKFYFDFTMLALEVFLVIIPFGSTKLATCFFSLLNKKSYEKI